MERLVILGAGESGVGTAILGKQKGFEVFVSDSGNIQNKYKQVLEHHEIKWEENRHSAEWILNADLVMKSPGIPEKVEMVKKLREKGIPVISEIEFAWRFTRAEIIGITGSNGKTTVTTWVQYILKNAGKNSIMAGNIGKSFAEKVAEKNPTHFVLELSSFQLDGIVDFRPHIAVITNITPDHLDRYQHKFDNYIDSKFQITKNQTEDDFLIYDADDKTIVEWLEKHPVKPKKLPLTFYGKPENGAYSDKNKIFINIAKNQFNMKIDDLALRGEHNVKNAMAAATVSKLLQVRKHTIRESLASFHGVEHRLEKVLKINNVEYINDSKATNVNAAYYALGSVNTGVVWIVGGEDKGNDYKELFPLVNEKVKAIICLGKDNSKILDAFGNCVETIVETFSMGEAVKAAYAIAERGDTVLLSPACASFDLFENYEDRGRQFKEAVRKL